MSTDERRSPEPRLPGATRTGAGRRWLLRDLLPVLLAKIVAAGLLWWLLFDRSG